MVPYTYLIGWTKHNKYYYGVQFGKDCHPDNLWVKYFSSSKNVKAFRKEFGEPDIIQIRNTFKTSEQAINWETKVLKRLDVIHNSKWLNQSNNRAIVNTPDMKLKLAKNMSIIQKEVWKRKLSDPAFVPPRTGIPSPLKGVKRPKFSSEWRTNMSQSIRGFKWYHNPETLAEAKINFNKGHIVPEGFIPGRIPGKHGGSKGTYSKERYIKGQATKALNDKPSPLIGKKRSEEDKAAMRRGKAEAKLRRIAINT